MGLREQLFGESDAADEDDDGEQLAESNPYADTLEPKGRNTSRGFFSSYLNPILGRDERSRTYTTSKSVDVSVPPKHLSTRYDEYVQTKPLIKAPLTDFAQEVAEPGWMVEATIDGETDEEMTDALEMWGANCYVHAQEAGHDIHKLITDIPEKRRGKGTIYIEKAGTRGDGQSLGGLMLLDPSSIKVYSRENQPLLIQPDDDVPPDHPRTEDGRAAAYVQYDESLDAWEDNDPIAFAADDLIKITYDPQEGSPLGTPIWVQLREHIDSLYQKLRDRNTSIRINGHPWRIISNEHWNYDEASRFLEKHYNEEISHFEESDSKVETTFAGRLDAVPHDIDIKEHTGSVPDIADAIHDDIQAIFAVMPISQYKIAYSESINQFVVEPQERQDDRLQVDERQLIREYLEPVFEEKADELADGDEYEGEITWKIEQPTDENPLERESFDAEEWARLAEPLLNAGAPLSVAFSLAGMDRDEFEDQLPELDESDPDVQAAAEAMGIETPDAGDSE